MWSQMQAGFKSLFARAAVQRAWRSFLHSFLGLFLISLVGWMQSLVLWANGGEGAVFPHVSVLVKAGISAAAAAVIAVISLVHNAAEDATGSTLPLVPKG